MNPKYITYIYLAILLLGTLLPINGGNSALNNNYTLSVRWDYLLHALVYMPLPVLLFASIRIRTNSHSHQFAKNSRKFEANINSKNNKNHFNTKGTLTILLISLSIGTGLELLQLLVPYRAFNINDLVANGVGVTLGWIIMVIVRRKIAFA